MGVPFAPGLLNYCHNNVAKEVAQIQWLNITSFILIRVCGFSLLHTTVVSKCRSKSAPGAPHPTPIRRLAGMCSSCGDGRDIREQNSVHTLVKFLLTLHLLMSVPPAKVSPWAKHKDSSSARYCVVL